MNISGVEFDPNRLKRLIAFLNERLQRKEQAEIAAFMLDPEGHPLSPEIREKLEGLVRTFIIGEKQH